MADGCISRGLDQLSTSSTALRVAAERAVEPCQAGAPGTEGSRPSIRGSCVISPMSGTFQGHCPTWSRSQNPPRSLWTYAARGQIFPGPL